MTTAPASKMAENAMAKITATTPLLASARRLSLGGTPFGSSVARSAGERKSRKLMTAQVPAKIPAKPPELTLPQQVLPTPQGAEVALVQFEDNCRHGARSEGSRGWLPPRRRPWGSRPQRAQKGGATGDRSRCATVRFTGAATGCARLPRGSDARVDATSSKSFKKRYLAAT